MKKKLVIYWVITALFLIMMIASAIPDLLSFPDAVEGFKKMQLPAYLLPFLGVAKLMGALAIVLPLHTRLKEWAYAGLFFDLIGAIYCMIASGHPVTAYIFMLIPIALAITSYVLFLRVKGAGSTATYRTVNGMA